MTTLRYKLFGLGVPVAMTASSAAFTAAELERLRTVTELDWQWLT